MSIDFFDSTYKTILVQKWFSVFYKIDKGLKPPCSGRFYFEQWCFSPLGNCKPLLFEYSSNNVGNIIHIQKFKDDTGSILNIKQIIDI